MVQDKAVFHRYSAAVGIPVPPLLGILDRRGSGWGAPDRIISGRADWAAFAAHEFPEEFVVKPSEGYGGRGVAIVDRAARPASGRPSTPPRVSTSGWSRSASPTIPTWWRSRATAACTPHAVATLSGATDPPTSCSASSALARGRSLRQLPRRHDRQRRRPDRSRRRPARAGAARPDGRGLVERPDNPLTGERVEGRRLPFWPQVSRLVLGGAPHFMPMRALGWDVALTPDGPVIIETNTRWLPFPTPRCPPSWTG